MSTLFALGQSYIGNADHMTLPDACQHLQANERLGFATGSFNDRQAVALIRMHATEPEIINGVVIEENLQRLRLRPAIGMGVTEVGLTDQHPYHVIAITSDRVVTIRAATAMKDPLWSPEFEAGGFVGHVSNNHEQRWIIKPGSDGAPEIIIQLDKDGRWCQQGCRNVRFRLGVARRHYDYNF